MRWQLYQVWELLFMHQSLLLTRCMPCGATTQDTWFVKRRYRNFEKFHRHLKDIPNYTLYLPHKMIVSSSTEDAFVHQYFIQLDKYVQPTNMKCGIFSVPFPRTTSLENHLQ